MKRVVEFNHEFRIGEKDSWHPVSMWATVEYSEPKEEMIVLKSFDEALSFVENSFRNGYVGKTLFKKRPKLVLSTPDYDFAKVITEKNFKTIYYRKVYRDIVKPSIEYLAHNLSADDFAEWYKDKKLKSV